MQVNIKGKPFKVILEKDTFLKEGLACAGYVDYRDQKIYIATG